MKNMMKTTWLKKLLVGAASALALTLALSFLPSGAAAATKTPPPSLTSSEHNLLIMGAPDLVIVEAKVTFTDYYSGWRRVSFKVKNQGTGTASSSTAKVTTQWGRVDNGSHAVPSLAPGATSGPYFDYVNPNPCGHPACYFPAGSAGVQADYFNKVSESNEGNNWTAFK